jgi:alkylhydroperoxidase family enzyme
MLRTTSGGRAEPQGGASAFIAEPERINPLLRAVLWGIERQSGQPFVGGRLLAWHTPTAMAMMAAGGMTWIVSGRTRKRLGPRILDLVALAAAYTAGSPYCAADFAQELNRLEPSEIQALKAGSDVATVPSFTVRERLAIRYARFISATPLDFPPDFIAELTAAFTEPEIVMLAGAAADINFNGRLFEALGAPVPGLGGLDAGR